MRVIIISSYPPLPCGIGEYSKTLSEHLKKLSEVVVVGHEGSDADIPVRGARYKQHTGYANLFLGALKHAGRGIVHIQHEYGIWGYGDEFIRMLKGMREMGYRVVVTMHSVDHALKGAEVVAYNRKIGELADAVVVHSVLQELELAAQGVPQHKIRVIPHGTDDVLVLSEEEARKKIGLDLELAYGHIGFVRPDKNLEELLKAHGIVLSKVDATLVIAGSPQREKYEDYFRKLEREAQRLENVLFLRREFSSLEELKLYIAALDAVVLPYKGLGDRLRIAVSGALHTIISVLRPLVTSRESKFFEYLLMFPELTYPPGDVRKLADAVALLLSDESLRESVKAELKKFAERTSWSSVAESHIRLYEEVLGLASRDSGEEG